MNQHTESVNVLDGIYYKSNDLIKTIVCSSAADSTVKIWFRGDSINEKKFIAEQSIPTKHKGFAFALKFYILTISNCMLNYNQMLDLFIFFFFQSLCYLLDMKIIRSRFMSV